MSGQCQGDHNWVVWNFTGERYVRCEWCGISENEVGPHKHKWHDHESYAQCEKCGKVVLSD